MDIKGEHSASMTEVAQPPQELIIALPLSTTDASPFVGLVDRSLELVGAPSRIYLPAFADGGPLDCCETF